MKSRSMYERKISDPKNKPTGPHMAILVWDTVTVDTGWSRDEGGGPESRTIVEYHVFTVDEKKVWEEELKALQFEGKKTFLGIHVTAIAKLTVSVAVE
jgi:hypothetical protein